MWPVAVKKRKLPTKYLHGVSADLEIPMGNCKNHVATVALSILWFKDNRGRLEVRNKRAFAHRADIDPARFVIVPLHFAAPRTLIDEGHFVHGTSRYERDCP